jgi:ferritin-like metal-binding protein YciE
MTHAAQKVVQYLREAHATEQALVRVLQSQIATTPRGGYRNGLESHLLETRAHAERVQRRLSELGGARNPLTLATGLVQTLVGAAFALAAAPLHVVRGTDGEDQVLKGARETCAREALEIAMYTSIERLARSVGDTTTASLASSIRVDEQRMLDRLIGELPTLADDVLNGEVLPRPSKRPPQRPSRTAASNGGDARNAARKATRRANAGPKRTTRRTAGGGSAKAG